MTPEAAQQRLRAAVWLPRPETQRVFELLDGALGKTRAVGGIVRDTLLERGRDTGEIDFATELMPEQVIRRAAQAGIPVYPTGIEHGTVTVRVGHLVAEVTTLREDIETDGRHAVVKFGTNWTHDAQRRDFTLNALYVGMDGALFDPLGGLEDCIHGAVKFIGDADQRIAEDRLRVFRFFRFTASHGHEAFDRAGLEAVTRAAGTLNELSAERVGHEMRRMLGLPRVAKTLLTMSDAGVAPLPGDVLEQLGAYERQAPKPNYSARLALLVAALGASRLKTRWRLSNEAIAVAASILATARLLGDLNVSEAAYRYPAALSEAVDVAATLANWTEAAKSAVMQRLEAIDVPRFPISGNDLIAAGMRPGPQLGAELERLESSWIASEFRLDRAALLADIRC